MDKHLQNYLKNVSRSFAGSTGASHQDVEAICRDTYAAVNEFTNSINAVKRSNKNNLIAAANENLSFEAAMAASSVDSISNLVKRCKVAPEYQQAAVEQIGIIMNRCLGVTPGEAWSQQFVKASDVMSPGDRLNNRGLNTLYSDAITNHLENAAPGQEAFGIDIDKAVPDMNVSITVAIMNFHTRLAPRLHPVRSTTQPNVTYTKEYLEIYDLSKSSETGRRLVDLYIDPSYASNELRRIVPLLANEEDSANPVYLVKDNILKFGVTANILQLSVKDEVGFSQLNRTDLIAENVMMETVYVKVTIGDYSEIFPVEVPTAISRLTRIVNGRDSAIRNADIRFRYALGNKTTSNVDDNGTWTAGTTTILSSLPDAESIVLDLSIKPSVSLKTGVIDCLGAVHMAARHSIDNDQIVTADTLVANLTAELVGYTVDARFSEENLRKTNMAIFSHRQPFSFDIPIGRNYVYDYAIGQANAESNATRLTEVCGLGQDHVDLNICIDTIRNVHDQALANGSNKEDELEYIGSQYVAGDKVIPTCFIGNLDFTGLNVIRDADRSGDVIQKTVTYLTAATSKVLQESLLAQRLGGVGVTFKGVTSPEILGNVISAPHIHNHLNKDDRRNDGDGVEYVMVLPNGVVLKLITSTFDYMRDKILLFPTVDGNAESDLHFAHLWDYGAMVAQYTPSGNAAHHRLFANIRQLPLVTNPVGLYITVSGVDIVTGINMDGVLRPTVDVNVTGTVTTSATSDIYAP